MARKRHDKRSEEEARGESRRILERVGRESDANSLLDRSMERLRGHLAADDTDRDDPIELWGTRIGRLLAFAVCGVLIVWLFLYAIGW